MSRVIFFRWIIFQPSIYILLLWHSPSFCQSALDEPVVTQKISPKELSIPASPVFDFMGVTPSQVVRTNDIKDFKVDWSFRSYKLSPNLAIQAQPVWELLYNKRSLSKYQSASAFMRKMSTLDISVGTVETENAERRIGYGIKLNLFNQRDPLMMKELYQDLEVLEVTREASIRYAELKEKYDKASESEKFAMFEELEEARTAMETERAEGGTNNKANLDALKERIEKITRYLAYQYWNSYRLDIAFARTYNYTLNDNGSLASLKLNRNTGYGVWVNGGYGLGRKMYLSGMVRYTKFKDDINFNAENTQTGETTAESVRVDNSIITAGINFRYGSPAYTFFAEFLYERKKLGSAIEVIRDPELGGFPTGTITGISWDLTQPVIVSFGGDWRVSKNVILNYGFRGTYTKTWKLLYVAPVVNISCMMR